MNQKPYQDMDEEILEGCLNMFNEKKKIMDQAKKEFPDIFRD